ncbi:MAG: hypothetical protein V4712_17595 [Pseudomonadota bacterium]
MERDPFQPLSAKVSRPAFSNGGRELKAERLKMATSQSAAAAARRIQARRDARKTRKAVQA